MEPPIPDWAQNDPEMIRTWRLIHTSASESDRGVIILLASEADRLLESLLKSYLTPGKARRDLFEGANPPLQNFSTKIDLARSLCLIGEAAHKNLHLIRKVRNEFAHNPSANLEDEKIRSLIKRTNYEFLDDNNYRQKFEELSLRLIKDIQFHIICEINTRVYEESYNSIGRYDPPNSGNPFRDPESAAEFYK
jgi:hypothetical protein